MRSCLHLRPAVVESPPAMPGNLVFVALRTRVASASLIAVNFYAHAAVACWRDNSAAFVFGAMVPDLASMCGARITDIRHAQIRSGVTFHHRCDEAFHSGPTFMRLYRAIRAQLGEQGVPRGSAMAAAHLGIELLLDGTLLDDRAVQRAYRDALAGDGGAELRLSVACHSSAQQERLRRLRSHLADRGPPLHYQSATDVARSIRRILAARPRLALGPQHVPPLTRVLESLQPQVALHRDALLAPTHSVAVP